VTDPADAQRLGERLVDGLGAAAMYNDEGHVWTRNVPGQPEALRAGWRAEFRRLAAALAGAGLPPRLVDALGSGAAAEDGTGDPHAAARTWLAGLPATVAAVTLCRDSWTHLERLADGAHRLAVLCGPVGTYAVEFRLSPEEAAAYARDGDAYLDRLTRDAAGTPDAFLRRP